MEKINQVINLGNYKLRLMDQKPRIIENNQITPEKFREGFFEFASMNHYFKDKNQSYIVDESNQLVINQLYLYLIGSDEFRGNLYKGIILIGKIGCGKTLLMDIFVNIIEKLGDLGSYECFSEDTYSFAEALQFLRDEKE